MMCMAVFFSDAQTTVNSYNVNDSIWEKSNSPYYITGQITVPATKTLKIEPGVTIIFKGFYSLNISGFLDCKGTSSDKIIFKGDSLSFNTFVLWDKINIGSGFSTFNKIYYFNLKYCIFQNGGGIRIPGSKLIYTHLESCEFHSNDMCYFSRGDMDSFTNCTFSNNNVIFDIFSQNPVLTNSQFSSNKTLAIKGMFNSYKCIYINNGIGGISFYYFNGNELHDCNCSPKLTVQECSELNLTIVHGEDNIIENSDKKFNYNLTIGNYLSNSHIQYLKGVTVGNATNTNPATITKNTFNMNLIALELNGQNNASNFVTCNKFISNQIGLKFSIGQMDLIKNNYFNNVQYDAVNRSSQSQNLTQNYFGVGYPAIEDKLYDKDDTSILGPINYNIYNSNLQTITQIVAKDKSILTLQDTTAPIDTACLTNINILEIDLNTLDTICHKINTPYNRITPTVKSNIFKLSEISLTLKSDLDVYKIGLYYDEYTATDANGNVVKKKRWINVKENCGKDSTPNNTHFSTLKQASVYPNPASTDIKIELLSGNESTLTLIDAIGRTVWTGNIVENKTQIIDVSKFKNGIYYLSCKNNKFQSNEKILIQH